MTRQQRTILASLGHGDFHFGREIMKATRLPSGTVYPALALLVAKGYVESAREVGDPRVLQRPLRIHYRLTPRGATLQAEVTAAAPRRTVASP